MDTSALTQRLRRRPSKIKASGTCPATRDDKGPLEWFEPLMRGAYTSLSSEQVIGELPAAAAAAVTEGPCFATVSSTTWRDHLLDYKRRKRIAADEVLTREAARAGLPAPFVPGARNWIPLGPNVVANGQTVSGEPVAGRVSGLAVVAGGQILYAASANGGVYRSDDGATSWRSLMDRFDLDPTSFASASLVCGAIAVDPLDPRRVFVGTGEGDTFQLFRQRVTSALPAYRGVGVLRTDSAGDEWITEQSTPDLSGEAFFALAIDPTQRETVLGATTIGLYRREPTPGGSAAWARVQSGVWCSVIAAMNGGATRIYAARWGQENLDPPESSSGVFHSDDGGTTWTESGTGLPEDAGRIAIATQMHQPLPVYAFVADSRGALRGVFRLNEVGGPWRAVGGLPNVLAGEQGSYDLTIAVDPEDASLIYLGGDRMEEPPYGGSVWRCAIAPDGSDYRVTSSASIGTHAHADIHSVVHSPGNPNELWCTCDGGVFLNRNPRGDGQFAGLNNGLDCLCCNFLGQHPTDPSIIFSGLQDNGTARTAGGSIWTRVNGGDGGYCLVDWADPTQVLVFANGTIYRSENGGSDDRAWSKTWNFGWATMTQPIVGTRLAPQNPSDGHTVGAAVGPQVFISRDFGKTWLPNPITLPNDAVPDDIFALSFATPDRIYIGTTRGRVFRADDSAGKWLLTRIDNIASGPLILKGMISDVAIDWSDPQGESIYVCFGGKGDDRRVWWFNGTTWEVRSGASDNTKLLDVEHNALAVDPRAPNNVYVGADIGVWHSSDGGRTWSPLQNGLPDAPIFDLQIHPTQRLLRVATHGRGVFELALT